MDLIFSSLFRLLLNLSEVLHTTVMEVKLLTKWIALLFLIYESLRALYSPANR